MLWWQGSFAVSSGHQGTGVTKSKREWKTKRAQGRAAAMMQEGQDPGKSQHEGTRDASVAKQWFHRDGPGPSDSLRDIKVQEEETECLMWSKGDLCINENENLNRVFSRRADEKEIEQTLKGFLTARVMTWIRYCWWCQITPLCSLYGGGEGKWGLLIYSIFLSFSFRVTLMMTHSSFPSGEFSLDLSQWVLPTPYWLHALATIKYLHGLSVPQNIFFSHLMLAEGSRVFSVSLHPPCLLLQKCHSTALRCHPSLTNGCTVKLLLFSPTDCQIFTRATDVQKNQEWLKSWHSKWRKKDKDLNKSVIV